MDGPNRLLPQNQKHVCLVCEAFVWLYEDLTEQRQPSRLEEIFVNKWHHSVWFYVNNRIGEILMILLSKLWTSKNSGFLIKIKRPNGMCLFYCARVSNLSDLVYNVVNWMTVCFFVLIFGERKLTQDLSM